MSFTFNPLLLKLSAPPAARTTYCSGLFGSPLLGEDLHHHRSCISCEEVVVRPRILPNPYGQDPPTELEQEFLSPHRLAHSLKSVDSRDSGFAQDSLQHSAETACGGSCLAEAHDSRSSVMVTLRSPTTKKFRSRTNSHPSLREGPNPRTPKTQVPTI